MPKKLQGFLFVIVLILTLANSVCLGAYIWSHYGDELVQQSHEMRATLCASLGENDAQ